MVERIAMLAKLIDLLGCLGYFPYRPYIIDRAYELRNPCANHVHIRMLLHELHLLLYPVGEGNIIRIHSDDDVALGYF